VGRAGKTSVRAGVGVASETSTSRIVVGRSLDASGIEGLTSLLSFTFGDLGGVLGGFTDWSSEGEVDLRLYIGMRKGLVRYVVRIRQ
jgi:hypothetical protein